jgi:hypothetical protein
MAKLTAEADTKEMILYLTIDGMASVEEREAFNDEVRKKLQLFGGKPFGVLADLRKMRPGSPESSEKVRENQALLIKAGVQKSAEVVESPAAMLQLNRIARESGLLSKVQRFTEIEHALAWLRGQAPDEEGHHAHGAHAASRKR